MLYMVYMNNPNRRDWIICHFIKFYTILWHTNILETMSLLQAINIVSLISAENFLPLNTGITG